MASNKKSGSSSSSIKPELSGSNDSSHAKAMENDSVRSELKGKMPDSFPREALNTKPGALGISDSSKKNGVVDGMPEKEVKSIYMDNTVQPCTLSSSIYYGGQDLYYDSPNSQAPSVNTTVSTSYHDSTEHIKPVRFKNDIFEDDSKSTTRGNWWRGSLYY